MGQGCTSYMRRKMGRKYEKRYYQHFRDPDVIPFDMPHEAWLFNRKWKGPVLDAIDERMIQDLTA